MSTPPDFFTSDSNDPHRDLQPDHEGRDPAPVEEPRRSTPTPAGDGLATLPTAQPDRWQRTSLDGPLPAAPAAPRPSGPIPRPPLLGEGPSPEPPFAPRPSAPSPRPPAAPPSADGPGAGPGAAWPPPAVAPHNNNAGVHHRPPQQVRPQPATPPATSPSPSAAELPAVPPAPIPTRPPVRRAEEESFGERTSIISPDELAKARELGGFFNEPADPRTSGLPTGNDSHALFSGPMGGEPFVPSGYTGGGEPDQVVAATRRIDATGWRKAVRVMTFGLIKPGPSAKQLAADELVRRIRASLVDVFVVAFVNSKGGVGKTTMAVAAGNAIARERGDRVIVVDVDTDLGNLSARFHENGGANANIESFAALPDAGSYSKVRVFTVQNDDRLEMLSSQNDPRSSYRLSSSDFESTMKILRSHYNVVLLDCGTSITSPLFATIAKQVDCLVVVASQDAPGLNGAYRTQAWLAAHGLSRLLPRTVVVLNRTGPQKPKVDMDDVAAQFRETTEEVVVVPFDDHLDEGGAVEFDRMSKKTRKSVMNLAGSIARFYPSRQSPRNDGMGGY